MLLTAVCTSLESASAEGQASIPVVASARQVVAVVTDGWESVSGSMYRFSRDSAESPWHPVGSPWLAVIGMRGLAWGYGVHPAPPPGETLAVEGDDRSPAGVFRLFQQFGFRRPGNLSAGALPFVELRGTTECVDDPDSRFYNRIVDRDLVTPDWRSAERMAQYEAYRRGIDFSHNHEPVRRALGSCVFLHIWGGPNEATRGCTVIPAGQLDELAAWLEADAQPLLVQLPRKRYLELQAAWHLPPLPDAGSRP